MKNSPSEFELISLITKGFLPKDSRITKAIGDDCACIDFGTTKLLISNDDQIEGVHFLPTFDPKKLGYKTVASSVSDIVACGGKPLSISISLSIAPDQHRWAEELYSGIKEACDELGVSLIGGNTTKAKMRKVGAFVLGTTDRFVSRSGAKIGDLLYISSFVGRSSFALDRLFAGDRSFEDWHFKPPIATHLAPLISSYASSAIDVSDSFSADMHHLISSSGVGFEIESMSSISDQEKRFALFGGEDYVVLFTLPANHAEEAKKYNLYPIGKAIKENVLIVENRVIDISGFDHFKSNQK